MADVKISALPAATTPVAGTEVLPIVQSGTTKKLTIADVTAGRAMSASSLTLTSPLAVASGGTGATTSTGTGSVVLGTSPAITFPAGTVGAPGITTTGDTNTGIYFPAADTIGFVEGGVEAMRLDASGNLGLNVTPNTWFNVFKAIQIGGSAGNAAITGQTNSPSIRLWANAYADANNDNRYLTSSNYALQYNIDGGTGSFKWFTAPSGTAGNAISFTQAMTLDASANLSLTGRYQFSANASNPNNATAAFYDQAFVGPTINGNTIEFRTGTSGTYAARIDSSGNLLVGKTTTAVTTAGTSLSPNSSTFVCDTASTDDGPQISVANINASVVNGFRFFSFRINSGATQVGTITTNGSNATAYNTSSDISLKENIAPANSALASMLAFPVDQFDWKSGGHTDYGCVAQKVVEYAPEMVTEGELWGVDYGRVTPRLIKAFQELAAKVTALEDQLNA